MSDAHESLKQKIIEKRASSSKPEQSGIKSISQLTGRKSVKPSHLREKSPAAKQVQTFKEFVVNKEAKPELLN